MDTDVEVVKPLDELLYYDAFSGYETETLIPTGTMGAVAKNEWISLLLDYYNDRHFILPDGKLDLTTNVITITRLTVEKYGLKLDGTKKFSATIWQFFHLNIFALKIFRPKKFFVPKTRLQFTISPALGFLGMSWNVVYPFDTTNRWVIAHKRIIWGNLKEKYGNLFSRISAPYDPFKLFLGMLLLQDKYKFSNAEMLQHFAENKYFQYFCGFQHPLPNSPVDEKLLAYLHECCPRHKLFEIKFKILTDCPDLAETLL